MSVNTEAEQLINGARQSTYGHPLDDFTRTAYLWQQVLGVPITPEQVALCMILVKVARLVHSPFHRDSVVDICGYAGTIELIWGERMRRHGAKDTDDSGD